MRKCQEAWAAWEPLLLDPVEERVDISMPSSPVVTGVQQMGWGLSLCVCLRIEIRKFVQMTDPLLLGRSPMGDICPLEKLGGGSWEKRDHHTISPNIHTPLLLEGEWEVVQPWQAEEWWLLVWHYCP